MRALNDNDREVITRSIELAPELEKTDGWAAAEQRYGASIELAEGVGRLTQLHLLNDLAFPEAAAKAIKAVLDYYQPDGDMHGIIFLNAVSLLEKGWKRGSELRQWHSSVYGV